MVGFSIRFKGRSLIGGILEGMLFFFFKKKTREHAIDFAQGSVATTYICYCVVVEAAILTKCKQCPLLCANKTLFTKPDRCPI